MFQDALILHIMYSFEINSETVVLLTFDSIDENGKMRYFDTLKLKYIHYSLYKPFVLLLLLFLLFLLFLPL